MHAIVLLIVGPSSNKRLFPARSTPIALIICSTRSCEKNHPRSSQGFSFSRHTEECLDAHSLLRGLSTPFRKKDQPLICMLSSSVPPSENNASFPQRRWHCFSNIQTLRRPYVRKKRKIIPIQQIHDLRDGEPSRRSPDQDHTNLIHPIGPPIRLLQDRFYPTSRPRQQTCIYYWWRRMRYRVLPCPPIAMTDYLVIWG